MLNELDRELERRGHRFVRYADDCMIFCKSRKSAERTLRNILPYIEGNLFLKVNREKTCVSHISKVKYLGYTFYNHKGFRFRVHTKSVEKMKKKLKELTNRSNSSLLIKIMPSESIELILPYLIHQIQFSNEDWRGVQKRNFQLVFSLYPQKNLIELN